MSPITRAAWAVLRTAFQDGESVILEDSGGSFYRGKLIANNECVTITRPHGISNTIDWDDVELIAHGGFPVQALLKMTREEATDRAQKTIPSDIRKLLKEKHELELEAAFERGWNSKSMCGSPRIIGGGCPFVAGPCGLVTIHNRGNTGPRFDYSDAGEVLVFQSADGAIMHSYDTDHLFLLPSG